MIPGMGGASKSPREDAEEVAEASDASGISPPPSPGSKKAAHRNGSEPPVVTGARATPPSKNSAGVARAVPPPPPASMAFMPKAPPPRGGPPKPPPGATAKALAAAGTKSGAQVAVPKSTLPPVGEAARKRGTEKNVAAIAVASPVKSEIAPVAQPQTTESGARAIPPVLSLIHI